MLIFSTFFHFKFFKALTVNFSLIDHLLFFMCMQEPSSDTGFSPHRPEGFPNMLFFPLLRANMITLFSAPSCSFFPRLSLSLQPPPVFGSPAISPELPPRYLLGQGQRPNTITHVCWYRNQNLSLTDYLRMNQVLDPLTRKRILSYTVTVFPP